MKFNYIQSVARRMAKSTDNGRTHYIRRIFNEIRTVNGVRSLMDQSGLVEGKRQYIDRSYNRSYYTFEFKGLQATHNQMRLDEALRLGLNVCARLNKNKEIELFIDRPFSTDNLYITDNITFVLGEDPTGESDEILLAYCIGLPYARGNFNELKDIGVFVDRRHY